jgi:hypothetical protein
LMYFVRPTVTRKLSVSLRFSCAADKCHADIHLPFCLLLSFLCSTIAQRINSFMNNRSSFKPGWYFFIKISKGTMAPREFYCIRHQNSHLIIQNRFRQEPFNQICICCFLIWFFQFFRFRK